MATHHIQPDHETLHGYFSRERAPILTIDSGDTVFFKTLDAGWGLETPVAGKSTNERKRFEFDDPALSEGHALCGPIAIRGAKAGMVLEIEIGEMQVGPWGYTRAAGWPHAVNDALGMSEPSQQHVLVWELDNDTMTAVNQHGHLVTLQPFMGVMGMPPPEAGMHPTAPPRIWGGNIDCKELVAGTILYLPIPVDGAMFSTGDGHGAQGDGEICVTAIECPIERVGLTLRVRDDMQLDTPRARLANAWMTLGFHEDLHEATMIALREMMKLLGEQYDMTPAQALGMASVVVDFRITQVANGTLGVHAILPDGAIR